MEKDAIKSKLKAMIIKDKLLQVLSSVALAFLLWFVAISNSNPTVSRTFSDIDITILNQDQLIKKGLILEPIEEKLLVNLKGDHSLLSRFRKSSIKAYCDISRISSPGTSELPITLEGIPSTVSVSSQSPFNLQIEVNTIAEKSLNFAIDKSGKPAPGYAQLGIHYDPTAIRVSGSGKNISKDITIKGTIDLTDRKDDYNAQVVLKPYDENNKEITNLILEPYFIKVEVSIGKTKTVPIVVKSVGDCANNYYAKATTSKPSDITIAGKENDLEDITAIYLNDIDVTSRYESFTAPGNVILPQGITIIDAPSFQVSVEISNMDVNTFVFETVQVHNIPPGLSYIINTEAITVTVMSDPGGLKLITSDDIQLYIDLDELAVGTHEVKINFQLPRGVQLKDASTTTVSVELKER
jgi:YbbR domain-containing protein